MSRVKGTVWPCEQYGTFVMWNYIHAVVICILAYLPSHLVLLHLYLGCRVCLVSVCSECIPSSSWYERCKIALVARMIMDSLLQEECSFHKIMLQFRPQKMFDLWSTQIFKMWIMICQCCKISSKFGWYKPVFSYTELKCG